MTFWKEKRVLVTGGAGFVGSFVVEKLLQRGVTRENINIPRSRALDLRRWEDCLQAVKEVELVIHLAGHVGGIGLNHDKPAELFYDNAIMGIQLLEASRQAGVEKVVVAGTICSYPKFSPIPFKEDNLWNGYPEETNAPYGLAKKMLLVQAQAYRQQYGFNAIYVLPVNLYGPRDNFDFASSHVIPALIRKCIEAVKEGKNGIRVWGTGKPSREFLYVEDAAEGILLAAERYNKSNPVNLGAGFEITIKELVDLIAKSTGFGGAITWEKHKPDGQPRRSLDTMRAKKEFGFEAQVGFEEGLKRTVDWYLKELEG